jgi:hypothetical protein
MSVKMINPRVMIPPPPMPWTERPISSTVKSRATQAIRLPAVKKAKDKTRSNWRPKISERAAMEGWNIAQVRRYDVPAQNVSVAVPPSSSAMDYLLY